MRWSRLPVMATALATMAFQIATEAHAVPATPVALPWLDGRPVIEVVAPGPMWRPSGHGPVRFIRFDAGFGPSYGILEDAVVQEIAGDLFSSAAPNGLAYEEGSVRILAPLGAAQFNRAYWLGDASASDQGVATAVARIGAGDLRGPNDVLELSPTAAAIHPVLVLVVGGPPASQGLFGVAPGMLGASGLSPPRLALGPSLVRGLDPGELRFEAGADGFAGAVPRLDAAYGAALSHASALIDQRLFVQGDVLLLPVLEAIRFGSAGPLAVFSSIPEAGELRCSVLLG
jgi:hypothetical protein